MIKKGRNSYLAAALRTSLEIRSGATLSEKNLQDEHCGSPYSMTVTGAVDSPRTVPDWEMPCSCASTCAAPCTLAGGELLPLLPPDWLMMISTTITAAAANAARLRYWMRRFRARAAAASLDAAARR